MRNVPKLRFPEFSGGWEKNKLGQLGSFMKGSAIGKKDLSENGEPCILYGELYTKYGEIVKKVVSKTDQGNKKLLRSKYGDVLVPASGETADDISTTTCVLEDNVVIGGDINLFRGKTANGVYISYALNHKRKNEIARLAQGASIVHIYSEQLKNIEIPIPSLPEQTKIADFLTLFDKKIEKQAEKVALLEEYKKGLMQKIFSRELRFKDDKGRDYPEWRKKKAKEIFYNISDKNHNGDLVVLSVTQDRGTVIREEMSIDIKYNRANLKNYKKVKKDNFIISLRSFQGGIDRSNHDGLVSPAYTIFDLSEPENHEPKYFGYTLKSKSFINRLNTLIYGIRDGKTIGFNDFSELPINVPPKPEQTKIANFLTLFDRKIDKEKEKLEALREQKKGLLQQMFV